MDLERGNGDVDWQGFHVCRDYDKLSRWSYDRRDGDGGGLGTGH